MVRRLTLAGRPAGVRRRGSEAVGGADGAVCHSSRTAQAPWKTARPAGLPGQETGVSRGADGAAAKRPEL